MNISKLSFGFKDFVYLAIIVAVIILFKQCGGNKTAIAKLEYQRDSLSKLEEKAWETTNNIARKLSDTLQDIAGKKELSEIEAKETRNNLIYAEKRIDKLIAEKLPAPTKKDTSGLYLVPEKYISDCETCYDLLKTGKDTVKKYISQRDSIDILSKKQIALHKKLADTLQNALNKEHSLFNALNLVAKDAIKKATPHSHLYAGTKLSGNLITPFNQVGGMINFLDKKGRMFTVGGGLQVQASWYAEAGISIRIF